jgi:hypothetical protein
MPLRSTCVSLAETGELANFRFAGNCARSYRWTHARVAELVDAHDSKSCSARSVGSIPSTGTSTPLPTLVEEVLTAMLQVPAGKARVEGGETVMSAWLLYLCWYRAQPLLP